MSGASRAALTSPSAELDLVTLEVSLVLHNFYKPLERRRRRYIQEVIPQERWQGALKTICDPATGSTIETLLGTCAVYTAVHTRSQALLQILSHLMGGRAQRAALIPPHQDDRHPPIRPIERYQGPSGRSAPNMHWIL